MTVVILAVSTSAERHGATLAQETNLHSKFHSCQMWSEISGALTSRDARQRKLVSPLSIICARRHSEFGTVSLCFARNVHSRVHSILNTIVSRGAEMGYEITESDSSSLTLRRWPCFGMFLSLRRVAAAFFLFHSQLFAVDVVADGNCREMSIWVGRLVLVTTRVTTETH